MYLFQSQSHLIDAEIVTEMIGKMLLDTDIIKKMVEKKQKLKTQENS